VLNFELDFGPVLKSSGSNFGSGLNFGNTTHQPLALHMMNLCLDLFDCSILVNNRALSLCLSSLLIFSHT
jgi:hypothetical protein